tara:strand:+ start:5809 stop:5991 length:183 start_codon:yes stop_codon:yes gene_type:complete
MKNWLILTMMKSKKFWYAVSAVVIPALVMYLGVDEETATNLYQAILVLILGQGIADVSKK